MRTRVASLLATVVLLVPAIPGRAQDGDIVVSARKLRDWRAVLVVGNDDTITCRIMRSTGDAALDTRACAAQKQCYETARPKLLAAGRARPALRQAAMARVNRDMAACFGIVSRHIAAYPLED